VFNPTQRITFAIRGDRNYDHGFAYNWRYALQHFNVMRSTSSISAPMTTSHLRHEPQAQARFYRKTTSPDPWHRSRNYLYRNSIEADTMWISLMGDMDTPAWITTPMASMMMDSCLFLLDLPHLRRGDPPLSAVSGPRHHQ
jgi:hypothetical protein